MYTHRTRIIKTNCNNCVTKPSSYIRMLGFCKYFIKEVPFLCQLFICICQLHSSNVSGHSHNSHFAYMSKNIWMSQLVFSLRKSDCFFPSIFNWLNYNSCPALSSFPENVYRVQFFFLRPCSLTHFHICPSI